MNKNRNPEFSREMIEARLREFLGVTEILWLGLGTEGDDTDGHIDNLARFVSERVVVTVVEQDRTTLTMNLSRTNLRRLQAMTVKGQSLEVIEFPMPGRMVREDLVLPASYANFYIANTVVLVPTYAQT